MTGLPIVSDDPIHRGDPTRLAALLGGAGEPPQWGADDLRAILAHQLRAPLLFDLHRLGVSADTDVPAPWAEAAAQQIRSFGDLLAHPVPPRGLLLMTKAFAKMADAPGGASALPPEVASILYFATIAVGLLRLRERITGLGDATLAAGFAWCRAREWAGPELHRLFERATPLVARVSTNPEAP